MKKERQSLKTFFATNKIPTAENFADLIDSGINQSEDGIKKDAGGPVSVQAEGSGEGVQDLLFFYKNFSDPNPSWRVNQNPRFDAKDPATSKAGLNISDANALSRLFIKADDGNIGIGTLSPTQKLSVKGGALVGGVDNVAFGLDDRDGARLGIIKKEGVNAPQICSSRDAPIIFGQTNQADIFTNIAGSTITERVRIDAQGKVGIGTSTPVAPLSFANQLGDKIALWGQAANNYGFGIQGALLQIHTDTSNADIAFGSGSSAAFNETMRIKGNGTVGIGTNNPTFPLTFANVAGDKISLWGQGGNSYGFGIQSGVLQIHSEVVGSDVVFGYGSSAALTETMRIKGTGNVGIGTNNPVAKLAVNGNAVVSGALGIGQSTLARAESRMSVDGTLRLRSFAPQIDFLDTDGSHKQWSIHVNESKMYFIREPWELSSLTLDGVGNVGIGTTVPLAKLQVVGGSIMPSIGKEGSGIEFPNDGMGIGSGDRAWIRYFARTNESMTLEVGVANDGDDHLALTASGNVGVGTYSPISKLHVAGDGRFDGSVVSRGNLLLSDQRVKTGVVSAHSARDLELVNQLQVVDYRLKDEVGISDVVHKGFIAQDVEHIFPAAINKGAGFIPDVYCSAESVRSSHDSLYITMKDDHGLTSGDTVRLIVAKVTREVKVETTDNKTFVVQAWGDDCTDVFVYGKMVDDFRSVNYNSIFTVGISAIQELCSQVQDLKSELFLLRQRFAGSFAVG